MTHDETEWTEAEREAMDRLPREVDPGALLEERTVAALKERGLLRPGGSAREAGRRDRPSGPGRPSGPPSSLHPAWWVAGLAAALAIFLAGLAAGQARAGVTTGELMAALRSAETAERPSLIQHTGSLYVDAIAGLATATNDREAVGTGVEVGLTALYAAAYELARLHPQDPRLQRVLDVLEQQPMESDGDPETDVHWF